MVFVTLPRLAVALARALAPVALACARLCVVGLILLPVIASISRMRWASSFASVCIVPRRIEVIEPGLAAAGGLEDGFAVRGLLATFAGPLALIVDGAVLPPDENRPLLSREYRLDLVAIALLLVR